MAQYDTRMAHKSIKKKKPRINVRFRELKGYKDVLAAVAIKDTSITKFIEKAAVAAAREIISAQERGEVNA